MVSLRSCGAALGVSFQNPSRDEEIKTQQVHENGKNQTHIPRKNIT